MDKRKTRRSGLKVEKRDGRLVGFEVEKIYNAVEASFKDALNVQNLDEEIEEKVAKVTARVVRHVKHAENKIIKVEDIQDIIEDTLLKMKETAIAKSFIGYRRYRTEVREANTQLMKDYKNITFSEAEDSDVKRENANVDGNTAMGTMLQYGATGSKQFAVNHILDKKHSTAFKEGRIHIHDLDFEPTGTLTCCQIDFDKLARGGFSTGHGHLREPQDISSYAALAAIAIQSDQNDQHGGQSIPNFDYSLATGVKKTFVRDYQNNLAKILIIKGIALEENALDILKTLYSYNEEGKLYPRIEAKLWYDFAQQEFEWLYTAFSARIEPQDNLDLVVKTAQVQAYKFAKKETTKKTYQAMEAFLHNLNTMHSRAGAQVPFSSINFGTDTTAEGRLVVEQFLLATEAGLGNGETAIFPISIFKVKEGINYNSEDINYDLFKLAMRVSAKRLFPNFSFIDAPFNLQYYKEGQPETEIAYMGCRTRVIGSVFPESDGKVFGRGNNSFTTINLPRLGIKHGIVLGERDKADWKGFYAEFDELIDIVFSQLLERYEIQKKKKVKNFPFLMGQGVWMDSDKLDWEDTLEEVIKHGTLTVGFIGLAETLKAMIGVHHGETEEAQKIGLEIISYLKKRCDDKSQELKLNMTVIATPAEGLSGRFVRMDNKLYGTIPGVTDREYYTNSFHIPVYYPISAAKKIELEAPYHALTNAGHISYIELDGDPAQNLEAFEMVIRKMKESGIGYGSVNHPVDRDPICGFNGVIGDRCPKCGRLEGQNGGNFERIRRITGYLVGTVERFNDAKKAEVRDRVKHC
jgi:ribonucleoside-triphosphate reductase